MSGLRGRRRVRQAPGAAEQAGPPGSRDRVGLRCRGGSGDRGWEREEWEAGQREVGDTRTEGTWPEESQVGREFGD